MKRLIFGCAFLMFISCNEEVADKASSVDYSAFSKSELTSAVEVINQKLRTDINNHALYFERSQLFQAGGDFESAMNDINRALKLAPNVSAYHQERGVIFLNVGDLRQAENCWTKSAELDPENYEVRLKLSELHYYRKEYNDAMKYANEALKINMYSSDAYYLKGMIHLGTGDSTLAISSLQTAVEQDPNFFEAYFQLGILFAVNQDKLGLEYYDNALRIQPNNIDVLYNKGFLYQELELYNEALRTYSEILKLDPNFKHAHFNMGYINMFNLKEYKQGAIHFNNAINSDPEFYQAYYNRGYCYELLGDVIRAKVDYENALKIKPDYTMAALGMERVTQ